MEHFPREIMLDHKIILNKCKRSEILLSIFSNHSGWYDTRNYTKKTRKFTNMWRLNNMVLNSQLVKEEIIREIKIPCNKWKSNTQKCMGFSISSSKREVHSEKWLPLYLEKLEKEQTKPSRRKEITKIEQK